jgi:glycosyltransferase involved in cell wall biosynthesis
MKISVVICAYADDRSDQLLDAVRSLHDQTRAADQTIVVIDHNNRLLERASAQLRDVEVLGNAGPQGLSAARNTGIRHAHGDIVAFLDDDARADPGWLEQLERRFAESGVAGVGGWVEPSWDGIRPRWLAEELYWIVGCSYRGLPADGAPVRNAIGANMAFRRTILMEIGGFREGVGQTATTMLRNDDTEIGIRVRGRWPDARIIHVPAARVEHAVPESRASWRYLFSRCWNEGRGKAVIARHLGASEALASERVYVRRTLPAGIRRALAEAARGDRTGVARAASIVAALTATGAGYAVGRVAPAREPAWPGRGDRRAGVRGARQE